MSELSAGDGRLFRCTSRVVRTLPQGFGGGYDVVDTTWRVDDTARSPSVVTNRPNFRAPAER